MFAYISAASLGSGFMKISKITFLLLKTTEKGDFLCQFQWILFLAFIMYSYSVDYLVFHSYRSCSICFYLCSHRSRKAGGSVTRNANTYVVFETYCLVSV